ncbi:MAG: hypothetical protein WBO07_07870 [Formosimonas sp.]
MKLKLKIAMLIGTFCAMNVHAQGARMEAPAETQKINTLAQIAGDWDCSTGGAKEQTGSQFVAREQRRILENGKAHLISPLSYEDFLDGVSIMKTQLFLDETFVYRLENGILTSQFVSSEVKKFESNPEEFGGLIASFYQEDMKQKIAQERKLTLETTAYNDKEWLFIEMDFEKVTPIKCVKMDAK